MNISLINKENRERSNEKLWLKFKNSKFEIVKRCNGYVCFGKYLHLKRRQYRDVCEL